MARLEVPLTKGLNLGDKPQTLAILHDLDAGSIMEAAEASEKCIETANGPVFVQSPARMGAELLCRQIESIGDIPGPISRQMLGKLCREDLARLQEKADLLDDAVAEAVSSRGRDDPADAGAD